MTAEQLAALLKLLLYAGALVGGGMAVAEASLSSRLGEAQRPAPRWIAGGAATALMAALGGAALLLHQLGGFDEATVGAVLAAPTGLALGLQLAGGALLLVARRRASLLPLRLTGAAALLAAFGVSGHPAAESPWAGAIAALHLLAAAWWLGSLLLLRSACVTLPPARLAELARFFGKLAMVVVGSMVASGAALVLALMPLRLAAWSTGYGQNLLVKIAFAAGALAIAAYARQRLVPRVEAGDGGAPSRLRRTVTVEIALIGGALAATAWLTTFHSPHEYHLGIFGASARADPEAPEPVQPVEITPYAALIKAWTGKSVSPGKLHEQGLAEVQRLENELRVLNRQLRNRPPQPPPRDVVALYQRYLYDMQIRLPLLFGRLPAASLEVVKMDQARAAKGGATEYVPPARDGSRPGRLMVDPEALEVGRIEARTYHEGLPGRHLQTALGQELRTAPPSAENPAFVEGWALYAEGLAYELGLFQDPASRAGQVQGELLATVRLVVDTGLSAKSWTPAQAEEYFRENASLGEAEAKSEVQRCLAEPGRALAAKLGQLEILALRRRAEQAQGGRFDVRAFHDLLLGDGAPPLDVLERRVTAWLEAKPEEGEGPPPPDFSHSH